VSGSRTALLDELIEDAPPTVRALIAAWSRWRDPVLRAAGVVGEDDRNAQPEWHSAAGLQWLAPVMPGKLLCVGANYHDHVAEMAGPAGIANRPAPFPFSFLKPSTSLTGSGQAVALPSYGKRLDWEAELAVVIGDPSCALGGDPLAAVFGYTILNDLSLRDFIPFPHALGLDAVVSKGFDGAAPMGPWITLAGDVPDPQSLPIELRVNGEVMQNSSTAEMIFGIGQLIRHYARVLSLQPGDVIATGTPAGVGAARRPARFLVAGDDVQVRIGELGLLETRIEAAISDDPLSTTSEVTA
jgi:2,4-didehydro-3-deoxy-L-rhamnonate hydrolase